MPESNLYEVAYEFGQFAQAARKKNLIVSVLSRITIN